MTTLSAVPPSSPKGSPRLHSIPAIAIATVLGGPAGGTVLLANNYFRLRMKRQGSLAVVCGIIATVLLIIVATVIPDSWHIPNIAFWMPQVLGMHYVAKSLQDQLISQHVAAGGTLISKWVASGVGVLSALTIFAVAFSVFWLSLGPTGTRLTVGQSEVYFSGQATKEDAQVLVAQLRELDFLDDNQGITLGISKNSEGFAVSFVLNDDALKDATVAEGIRSIGEKLASGPLGSPLTVWMCDDAMSKKKKIQIK